MQKRIWITWENQRRSIELSRHLGCELFVLEYSGRTRYLVSGLKTLQILFKKKPDILFVQNPSMVLATLACIYGMLTRVPVVVDRHTNFMLTKKKRSPLFVLVFKALNYFTIRFAALTIITNRYIAEIVTDLGGRPFILPDKLPTLNSTQKAPLKAEHNFLVVSSFAADEPLEDVIEAFKGLDPSYKCYITGNFKKADPAMIANAGANVVFTGFLSEQDYIDMVFSVEGVIVLTSVDYTMLCGCYEATTACKPLITSDKSVLTDYFKGALFIDNSSGSIRDAVVRIARNPDEYAGAIRTLKQELIPRWDEMSKNLEKEIARLGAQ